MFDDLCSGFGSIGIREGRPVLVSSGLIARYTSEVPDLDRSGHFHSFLILGQVRHAKARGRSILCGGRFLARMDFPACGCPSEMWFSSQRDGPCVRSVQSQLQMSPMTIFSPTNSALRKRVIAHRSAQGRARTLAGIVVSFLQPIWPITTERVLSGRSQHGERGAGCGVIALGCALALSLIFTPFSTAAQSRDTNPDLRFSFDKESAGEPSYEWISVATARATEAARASMVPPNASSERSLDRLGAVKMADIAEPLIVRSAGSESVGSVGLDLAQASNPWAAPSGARHPWSDSERVTGEMREFGRPESSSGRTGSSVWDASSDDSRWPESTDGARRDFTADAPDPRSFSDGGVPSPRTDFPRYRSGTNDGRFAAPDYEPSKRRAGEGSGLQSAEDWRFAPPDFEPGRAQRGLSPQPGSRSGMLMQPGISQFGTSQGGLPNRNWIAPSAETPFSFQGATPGHEAILPGGSGLWPMNPAQTQQMLMDPWSSSQGLFAPGLSTPGTGAFMPGMPGGLTPFGTSPFSASPFTTSPFSLGGTGPQGFMPFSF